MRKRGIKVCPECGKENGARSYECVECDYEFPMRKKRRGVRKKDVADWTQLKSGDVVRLVGRSGSYYIDNNGDKQYLLSNTIYKIYKLVDDGIVCHGKYGTEFIYCGPEREGIVSSIVMCQPKIKLLVGHTDPLVARRRRNASRRAK